MDTVEYGALKLKVESRQDKVHLMLEGKSDSRNPGDVLGPYFDNLLEAGLKELLVDLTKLEFMNSSTIPPLVQLMKKLEVRQISSEFVYDGKVKWQAVSFNVLQKLVISMKLKNITIRPTG